MSKAIQAIRRGETLTSHHYILSVQVLVTLRVACDESGIIRATRFGVRTALTEELPENTVKLRDEEVFYNTVLIPKGLRPPTSLGNKAVGGLFSLGHMAASGWRKNVLQTEQRFTDYGTTLWAIYSTYSESLKITPSRQFLIDHKLMEETDAYAVLQRHPCERLDPSQYVISS